MSFRKEIKEEYVEFLAQFAYMAYRNAMKGDSGKEWEDIFESEKRAWKSAVRASGRRILPHMFEEKQMEPVKPPPAAFNIKQMG